MGNSAVVGANQEQHLRALEYANRVRLARARMKRMIGAGELPAAEVVLSCPWQAHSMSISDLLMSQKRWGRTRCRRLLVSLSVPENKQVGTLTERQRLALAAVLTAKNHRPQPIDMIKLRGTYSEGFRIPSFNEAFGAPTTGYISQQVTDPAFLAAHNNNAYASQTYSIGLTASGNPALEPEESTSYTAGIVFEPAQWLSLTLDYWHIEVESLISNADYAPAIDLYYANNGVVDLEGITVVPGAPDPDFPDALPLLGFIQYSYQNVNSEIAASGIRFWSRTSPARLRHVSLSTAISNAHLEELSKTIGALAPAEI